MILNKLAVSLIALGLMAGTASAQSSDTLKKIKETGVISLGHRESSIPFSYYDDKQNVVGYSQDMAMKIVEAVKVKLAMPDLKVKLTPVTSQNRIPLVQNGTIDLECGSTTHDAERAKQVFRFHRYDLRDRHAFDGEERIGHQGFCGLEGQDGGDHRRHHVRADSAQAESGSEHGYGALISAKDHGESFLTLSTGRAVAFMMDDAFLAGERAKSNDPADFRDRRNAAIERTVMVA